MTCDHHSPMVVRSHMSPLVTGFIAVIGYDQQCFPNVCSGSYGSVLDQILMIHGVSVAHNRR